MIFSLPFKGFFSTFPQGTISLSKILFFVDSFGEPKIKKATKEKESSIKTKN